MARYDECSGVTSARGVTFQRDRHKPVALVHIRRHERGISPPPPPGAELLQPMPTQSTLPGSFVHLLVRDARTAHALDAVRIPQPADTDLAAVVHSLATTAGLPPGLGTPISVFRMGDGQKPVDKASRSGTQAVARALDILDAIAERPMSLADLAAGIGVSPPTCYRIARAMVDRGLLATSGRNGFALGPKAAELGVAYDAQRQNRDEDGCASAGPRIA